MGDWRSPINYCKCIRKADGGAPIASSYLNSKKERFSSQDSDRERQLQGSLHLQVCKREISQYQVEPISTHSFPKSHLDNSQLATDDEREKIMPPDGV